MYYLMRDYDINDKVKINNDSLYSGYEGIVCSRTTEGYPNTAYEIKRREHICINQSGLWVYGVWLRKDNNGEKCDIYKFYSDDDLVKLK